MLITKENLVCQYCGEKPRLGDSKEIYSKSYGQAYICLNYPKCDAYVGAHRHTLEPLGILADASLRKWKSIAHASFDTLWQGSGMSRTKAYKELERVMGLKKDEAHIGYFNVEQCQELVRKLNGPFTKDKD